VGPKLYEANWMDLTQQVNRFYARNEFRLLNDGSFVGILGECSVCGSVVPDDEGVLRPISKKPSD
jgi:hypothetical protein